MTNAYRLGVAAIAALAVAAVPASAQLFVNTPDFKAAPINGSDPLVGLPIPGATPAEYQAHLVWNLRAGLNVAALQCQFSPTLRSVDNYNSILAHHSGEFAKAYTALNEYFKRAHGAREGQRRFDDYSTSTYNNFSTLHAQYGFCQTSASIGRDALAAPKGQFHAVAERRMRELRNSLVAQHDQLGVYNPYLIRMPTLPPLREECFDRRGRLRKQCQTTG